MMSGAWRFVIRARRESRSRRVASDGAMSSRDADRIRSSACRSGRIGSVGGAVSALIGMGFRSVRRSFATTARATGVTRRSEVREDPAGFRFRVTGFTHGRRSRNDNTLANSANLPLNERVAGALACAMIATREVHRHGHEPQARESAPPHALRKRSARASGSPRPHPVERRSSISRSRCARGPTRCWASPAPRPTSRWARRK